MARPRQHPPELLDRGPRVVIESNRPIARVTRDLGVPADTLRGYVRKVEADEGLRPDLPTSAERGEITALREELYELRRATELLKAASVFLRPSSTQTDRGEPLHRRESRPLRRRADLRGPGRVGVRLLPRASGQRSRPAAKDERLLGRIDQLHAANYYAYATGGCARRCSVRARASVVTASSG
jgi:transposase